MSTRSTKKTKNTSSTKKKSKRSQSKYPALDPHLNLKTRQDLIDYDYLHKLSPKELEWLNKFTNEYTNASLNSEEPKKNLHKKKALRKDCYDRNNARNRDILTQQKAMKAIKNLDDIKDKPMSEENRLNAKIDLEFMGFTDSKGNLTKKI